MSETSIDSFYLPNIAVQSLPSRDFGKLSPMLTRLTETATPFIALDCFDQSLRRSGYLLLETDTAFKLLGASGALASQPSNGSSRFAAEFSDGPIKQVLAALSPLRRLLPLGSGFVHQADLAFVDDQQKTHCRAFFIFLITQAGDCATLVALQGLKGYDESLNQLRNHLKDMGGIALSSSALYDRLFPGLATYDPKPEILITNDETAFVAATRIVSTLLPIARVNVDGIIADHDTEFLHDYRIQLRKVRSVLSLFKGVYDDAQTADLKSRFSTLMAPTGPLRDLDVYLLERQKFYALLPSRLHGGLDTLFNMLAERRKAEQARLSDHLSSKTYDQEIASLQRLFTNANSLKPGANAQLPAHDYACHLIWRRYRKVCKIAMAIGPETEDARIHELRIHCKKLRYLMEFFSPIFPKSAFKTLLNRLKGLQDNLGLFNDYSVQQHNLHAFLLELPADADGDQLQVAQSIGALIAILHGRQLEERAQVVKNFAQFNSPETQQTFSVLFQARKDGA